MNGGTDLHIHTVFSDGEDTPEDCVLEALKKGLTTVGISDHSYIGDTTCEPYWMGREAEPVYKKTLAALREKYRGRIEVLCGIEQDRYSFAPAKGYDYVIGSVHFLKTNDGFFAVDESLEDIRSHLEYFDNDIYNFIEAYYDTVAEVVERTECDIIGHFDLVKKFNVSNILFDENDKRYVAAYRKAADALLKTGKPFEINTGALHRGYNNGFYPSNAVLEYLKNRGAEFVLSSDAHKKQNIAAFFDEAKLLMS